MKHMWRIKWYLGNTFSFVTSQTQVVHCIKQCKINRKTNFNPKIYRNFRLYTSTISTKD